MNRLGRASKSKRSDRTPGTPLAQRAYEAVRDAIDRGELAPGERVSEYQVADWLKISRTPAREALRRLEAEGLMFHSPQRGLVVVTVDDEALQELYVAREIIESSLARLAAINGSGPEISAILRFSELESSMIDDQERLYHHNRKFHELIYRAAHNRYLSKACIALHDVIATDRRGSNLVDPERCQAVIREHRALATAIAERRSSDAAEAAANHIRAAKEVRMRADPDRASAMKLSW